MSLKELPQSHLNDSIREINETSWIISNTFLLTRSSSSTGPTSNRPSMLERQQWGPFYAFPCTRASRGFQAPCRGLLFYLASPRSRQSSGLWRAGDAFIKAHHMDYPDVTREHVTLQFLKDQGSPGFDFPDVYHHFEIGSRYFLVLSRVPGQLLEEAWPNMDESLRQYYIGKVADVCNHLATWKGDLISGVDGHQLLERYLKGNSKMADALSPRQLLKNCTEMSMDVSKLVFYHCDLGPTNLLVDPATGSLGIIDWELAGYVSIEWVRTKFRLSAGTDFNCGDDDSKKDWRRRVAQHLEQMGYCDAVDACWAFQGS